MHTPNQNLRSRCWQLFCKLLWCRTQRIKLQVGHKYLRQSADVHLGELRMCSQGYINNKTEGFNPQYTYIYIAVFSSHTAVVHLLGVLNCNIFSPLEMNIISLKLKRPKSEVKERWGSSVAFTFTAQSLNKTQSPLMRLTSKDAQNNAIYLLHGAKVATGYIRITKITFARGTHEMESLQCGLRAGRTLYWLDRLITVIARTKCIILVVNIAIKRANNNVCACGAIWCNFES